MTFFSFFCLLGKYRIANLNFPNLWFQLVRSYNIRKLTRLLSMGDFQFEYLFCVRQMMQTFLYLLGQLQWISKEFTFTVVFQDHLSIGVKFPSNLFSPIAFWIQLAFRVLMFDFRRYIVLSCGNFFQNFDSIVLFGSQLCLLSKLLLGFFLRQFFNCFTDRVRKSRRNIFRFQ